MFGFGKKLPAPNKRPTNPGLGPTGKLTLSSGGRNWTEEVDLVRAAAEALAKHGHSVKNHATWLQHPASGYSILPQLAGVQLLDGGGMRTVTTVQVNHAALAPDGIFEYQHATGDKLVESVFNGLDQWVQTDFVALLDAARGKAEKCTEMRLSLPAKDGKVTKVRRAVLGPVSHFAQSPPAVTTPEEHPFCACCLLTRSFEAFKDLFQGDGFFGLRLYAARDQNGAPAADCRVNGDDFPAGIEALRRYAATWPAAGFEFRKQYVVLQAADGAEPE
jgi:Family of unknown function (DUF6348)